MVIAMKKVRVISCLSTILIMSLIFFFSSQSSDESSALSDGITHHFAEMIIRVFKITNITAESLTGSMHTLIRKCAHFTEYCILGISATVSFLLNTCRDSRDDKLFFIGNKKRFAAFVCVTVYCALYAVSDEMHQMFVPGRSAQLLDITVDTSGAAFGSIICLAVWAVIAGIKRKKKRYRYDF